MISREIKALEASERGIIIKRESGMPSPPCCSAPQQDSHSPLFYLEEFMSNVVSTGTVFCPKCSFSKGQSVGRVSLNFPLEQDVDGEKKTFWRCTNCHEEWYTEDDIHINYNPLWYEKKNDYIPNKWIMTATGNQVFPLTPDPRSISIEDIAMSLSRMCRFGGHSIPFYSVAEHSVHVASLVSHSKRLAALLHDATEAYLGDIILPVKIMLKRLGAWESIEYMERKLERAICEALGVQRREDFHDPEVKAADTLMVSVEIDRIMHQSNIPWHIDPLPEPYGDIRLQCWKPSEAREQFLNMYYRLTRKGD